MSIQRWLMKWLFQETPRAVPTYRLGDLNLLELSILKVALELLMELQQQALTSWPSSIDTEPLQVTARLYQEVMATAQRLILDESLHSKWE